MSVEEDGSRYRLSEDVVVQTMGDGAVVVDVDSDTVHDLNETAAKIVELLGEGRSIEEVAKAMAEEYDAEVDTVRGDVIATVGQLVDAGVLEPL